MLDALPGVHARRLLDGARRSSSGWPSSPRSSRTLLALDDDAWFDQRTARRARRRAGAADRHRRARRRVRAARRRRRGRCSSGRCAPATCRRCTAGSATARHRLDRLGDRLVVADRRQPVRHPPRLDRRHAGVPLGRQGDRRRSSSPTTRKSAAAIERAHSDGNGLLAHHGSSYGNLFSGDAERAVLTMSGVGRQAQGGPHRRRLLRLLLPPAAGRRARCSAVVVEIVPRAPRRRAAASPRRRAAGAPQLDATPCSGRSRRSSAATCRCRASLNDMCEGRAAIYVDLLGYDEVSHHSGPERADTLAVLRDLDRQIGRIERAVRWAPRPYRLVVLSDHGQTQGATFDERTGETLAELVGRLCGGATLGRPRRRGGPDRVDGLAAPGAPPGRRRTTAVVADVADRARLGQPRADLAARASRGGSTREEIDARYPGADRRASSPPGDRLRARRARRRVVGRARRRRAAATWPPARSTGDDPLAPFGPERRRAGRARSTATARSPT